MAAKVVVGVIYKLEHLCQGIFDHDDVGEINDDDNCDFLSLPFVNNLLHDFYRFSG